MSDNHEDVLQLIKDHGRIVALKARVKELEGENERVRGAIKDYACCAPLDLLSPREVQTNLLSINGASHQHVSSIGTDQCHLCKHDLRHGIHLRIEERG